MKLILSLSLFLSLSVSGAKPSCESALVRLALKPVPCINLGVPDTIFDIPELKLDLNDIEKIFQGAESSGGRVIGPMGQPRRVRPVTPFPINLHCELRLLADGGKRVSFLSFQKALLTQTEFKKTIPENQWFHGLISGNDINSTNWRAIPIAPKVNISNYNLELGYSGLQDELELNVCETFIGPMGRESSSFCAQGQAKVYHKTIEATLKGSHKSGDYLAIKTLKVSCQIR